MKRTSADLAVLGGPRTFHEPLHVGRPFLPDRERFLKLVESALDRNWLTNHGPLATELEERLQDRFGVPTALVSSGTLGLQLATRALGLRGSALVPSFTFVATPHALAWQGVKPVFCDVELRSHNLRPDDLRFRTTPDVSAVVPVHLWGLPCDIEGLQGAALSAGKKLLFDAAHAFDSTYGGVPIAQFGHATVFSFHATKAFSTVEGGAVASRDASLIGEIRLLRDFGFAGVDRVETIGINAKLNELCAAAGLVSLDEHGHVLEAYRERLEVYRRELGGLPGVSLHDTDADGGNAQYAVLTLNPELTRLCRDALLTTLHAEGVLARRYFYPGCHRMPPYSARPNEPSLPNTEALADRVLVLPTGPAVKPDAIVRVSHIIRLALSNPSAVELAARHYTEGRGEREHEDG